MHPHRRPNDSSTWSVAEMRLNSLELALLAEFNLEMAAAYDEVAKDPAAGPETRATARDSANRGRERAQLFQLEAQRLSAHSTAVPEPPGPAQPARYAGPKRRTRERRVRERRRPGPLQPGGLGGSERRVNPNRRRRDRRRADSSVREP